MQPILGIEATAQRSFKIRYFMDRNVLNTRRCFSPVIVLLGRIVETLKNELQNRRGALAGQGKTQKQPFELT
jgi:hypothetical protein